jgi:hypothetical protein
MTAARRSSRQGTPRRWLALVVVAVLAAGITAWWVWTPAPREIAPPMDDIDAESRERLEEVLREAERAERER